MQLNADVFYMDCKDLQVTQTNAACLCNITDAASAEIKGVEAEFLFAATDRLRLSLAGSYVDATIRTSSKPAIDPRPASASTARAIACSAARDAVDRRRRSHSAAGPDGRCAQFPRELHVQSDMFWATDNIAKEDAYGLLDVRVALSPPSSPWAVALWGKNVTDELYRVNIISFFDQQVSQFAAPATYGVDFSLKF